MDAPKAKQPKSTMSRKKNKVPKNAKAKNGKTSLAMKDKPAKAPKGY